MPENKSNTPKTPSAKKTTLTSKTEKLTKTSKKSSPTTIKSGEDKKVDNIKKQSKTSEITSKKTNCLITQSTYDTLVSNLSALFLYNNTIVLIKKDESFQNVILDYLNAIHTYEELVNPKEQQTDNFLVAYKTIVGKSYDPIIIEKDKIDDLDDKISFLNIYVKNTLNTEWSEILDSFKRDAKKIDSDAIATIAAATAGTTNSENYSAGSTTNNSTQSGQQQTDNANKSFNSQEFLKQNNVNFDQMADMAIMNSAKLLLYTKVLKNEYYVFDSKPSFFVWIKWFYLFGVILFGLTLLATFILQIIPMSSVFAFGVPTGNTPTELRVWFLTNSNITLTSALGNASFFQITIVVMIFLVISYNMIKTGWSEIKFRNNDNYRFSCTYTPIVFLIISLIWLSILPLLTSTVHPLTWFPKVLDNPSHSGDYTVLRTTASTDTIKITVNNAATYNSMLALSVLHISLLVFGAIAIIASLGIKSIAPKKNFEFINNTLVQISDDIKNNRINLDEIQNQFGGTISRKRMMDARRFLP